MAGVAGSTIGIAGQQPQIGDYVQDALDPTGIGCYTGVNTSTAWETNVLEEDNVAGFTAKVNNDVAASDATWVQAGGTIAFEGLCTITSGVAAADIAGLHQCLVTDGVVADQWFWAILVPV